MNEHHFRSEQCCPLIDSLLILCFTHDTQSNSYFTKTMSFILGVRSDPLTNPSHFGRSSEGMTTPTVVAATAAPQPSPTSQRSSIYNDAAPSSSPVVLQQRLTLPLLPLVSVAPITPHQMPFLYPQSARHSNESHSSSSTAVPAPPTVAAPTPSHLSSPSGTSIVGSGGRRGRTGHRTATLPTRLSTTVNQNSKMFDDAAATAASAAAMLSPVRFPHLSSSGVTAELKHDDSSLPALLFSPSTARNTQNDEKQSHNTPSAVPTASTVPTAAAETAAVAPAPPSSLLSLPATLPLAIHPTYASLIPPARSIPLQPPASPLPQSNPFGSDRESAALEAEVAAVRDSVGLDPAHPIAKKVHTHFVSSLSLSLCVCPLPLIRAVTRVVTSDGGAGSAQLIFGSQ